jgi:hypothetical protein
MAATSPKPLASSLNVSPLSTCIPVSGWPAVTCGRRSLMWVISLSRSAQYTDGLAKPVPRPVPVGVQAAATAGDDRAFLAGTAQPGQPLLPDGDAGMRRDHVERVAEDIQPGGRGTVERHFSESTCS